MGFALFPRPRRACPQTVRLELHTLESREVPAAVLSGGHLVVTGTDGPDTITLRVEGDRLSVMVGDRADIIQVRTASGRVVERTAVALHSVRAVSLFGRGGDDQISAAASPVGVFIHGGAGSDRLFGSRFADRIETGSGANHVVHGLAGDDVLVGDAGRDILYGGDGRDQLSGRGGNDELYGERGDDVLIGANGADVLDGGAGDADAADAFYGIDVTRRVENSTEGGSPLVVNGAWASDVRQTERPYCVFYSHLAGLAGLLAARGRNLAVERIEFVGRDVAGHFRYAVRLFTSDGRPVTHLVTYNGPSVGDPTAVDGEAWVTLFEKAFIAQIHAEDPTGSLWRRYWDHRTVMTLLTGACEQVHMIDHVSATFGATLGDEHFLNLAAAVRDGKLVTASTWNTPLRGVSTALVIREHNYTVVGVNEAARTITLRNPWGWDGGTPAGDPEDGLVTLSWADFRGSFQGYNVGVVA